jgi:hypothetical protein
MNLLKTYFMFGADSPKKFIEDTTTSDRKKNAYETA